ncbi:MAG TPA: methyltransferase domain-containing protein [Rugosimonospora sp.]|nr:methyltransferase domain-containing protein [Rugosimonospora sp.]
MPPVAEQWNWERPEQLGPVLDRLLRDMARCEKLEALPRPARLGELGVTGVEFAAWKTAHRHGLGSDLVPLRDAGGATTEPGRLYRVDGAYLFLQLDICRPLPFPDASLEWVYAEHLIEHVELDAASGWLAEVRRVLTPGGVLRLTTPDLRRYAQSYLAGGGFFARHRKRIRAAGLGPPMPARPAFMFNQLFYLYGHRWIYDLDELSHVLAGAGFAAGSVRACGFRDGARADVAELDRVFRNDETLYVEATA